MRAEAGFAERLAGRASGFLESTTSRRSFLVRAAVAGSALAVAPGRFLFRPGTAYASVCGDAASCSDGYTVFCCTINNGVNRCPPGTFVGGWWKADNAGFCCGQARYYIDCQGSCLCGASCGGYNSFCTSGCVNCSCHCGPGDSCDQRRVCCNYFRYGQCRQDIACGGPVACRVVTCTPPWQLDPSCSTASATDNSTVTHSAPCLPPACPTAIDAHYYDLGGPQSFLGQPTGAELRTPDGVGAFRYYQGGAIYWSPGTGAHEIHGAIQGLWSSLGWESSLLAYPVTDETGTPDGVGRYNHFQRGSIYWSPASGAHEVHGAIRGKWQSQGWETGLLRYPVTNELPTPDGVGRFNHFQGGSVYWTPSTDAHEVHGAIRDRWQALGWETGALGYPVTDELPTPDGVGRFNHFAKGGFADTGSIYWTPDTGAHEVHGLIREKWRALGWETSVLGYPVSDSTPTAGGTGRFNDFAKGGAAATGSIYLKNGAAAAYMVRGPIRAKWLSLGGVASSLGYPTSDEVAVAVGRESDFEHGTIVYNTATGEIIVTQR